MSTRIWQGLKGALAVSWLVLTLPAQALEIEVSPAQAISPHVLGRVQNYLALHREAPLRIKLQQVPLQAEAAAEESKQAKVVADHFDFQIDELHATDPAEQQLTVRASGKLGLHMGLYAALEALGYAFWHPFEPVSPPQLNTLQPSQHPFRPALAQRGFSHHTMHPLELTHVLNGWGPGGPDDLAGWEALLPEYEAWLEWLVAQRQNKLEWVLLEKAPWAEFSRSPERLRRLRQLVARAHDWGLQIGIDAPLALEQQNGWRLIPKPGDLPAELVQLRSSLDWLAAAGFDFITTEMGLSEFHHGGAARMLTWLNTAAQHLDETHKLPFFTKVHISSGQETPEFLDPETGMPLNINFLPYYADSRVGTMPHTVQIYSLDDPAPTYGWQDFSEMLRFMRLSRASQPERQMLWYPETAYWINYDINVPLFLPVYAQRRVHDLQLMAQQGFAPDGQMVFSSGFEWGYWLNDLLTARASWQAQPDMQTMLEQVLAPFGAAQAPWVALLTETMELQHQQLILGEVSGQRPETIERQNGMAYLAGQDTWSELSGLIRRFGLKGFQTQPERYTLAQLRQEPESAAAFRSHALPLLQAMESDFARLARRAESLSEQIPAHLQSYGAELRDGFWINAHRARFVRLLAEASLNQQVGQSAQAQRWLDEAALTLAAAQELSDRRTAAYRTDIERIAGWRKDATVYNYGYLWQARQLFFWRREWLQVASTNAHPCLLNVIDPLEVALPDPDRDWRAVLARSLAPALGLGACFRISEPEFR